MGKGKEEQYDDCPMEIYELAKTSWQKAVALEFFDIHKKLSDFSKDIEWLKYMIKGVFAVTVIAVVANLILKFI
jgi:hypothetical protein